jgi:hypothetical protein
VAGSTGQCTKACLDQPIRRRGRLTLSSGSNDAMTSGVPGPATDKSLSTCADTRIGDNGLPLMLTPAGHGQTRRWHRALPLAARAASCGGMARVASLPSPCSSAPSVAFRVPDAAL